MPEADEEVPFGIAASGNCILLGKMRMAQLALCGFTRVNIPAGKTAPVSFEIPVERFRYWDTSTKSYTVEPGAYELLIGSASDKLPKKLSVAVR